MDTKIILSIILVFFNVALESKTSVITFSKHSADLPPVVIIPGDGGCVVEARVNKTSSAGNKCPDHRDWYRIWLNVEELLPWEVTCQVENMKLEFDPITNTSNTPKGVECRIPGFGKTHNVEYIDDSWAAYLLDDVGAYAYNLVEALVSNGYVRDVSVRGAPYDFRLSMASQKDYFQKLRALIESTFSNNSNSRVSLISHSMGGLYTTWFLNDQSQAWKHKYIHSFISLSTPWAGSTESLQAIVSGFAFHVPVINPLEARIEQRSWESNFLLLPNSKIWPSDRYFILTDKRNYTSSYTDVIDLLRHLGILSPIYQYVRDSNHFVSPTGVMPPHPGVNTYCLYGAQVATNTLFDYRGVDFPDAQPIMTTTKGDGTVSDESLSSCREWNLKTAQKAFPGVTHSSLLTGKEGISEILNILRRKE